MDKIFVPPEFTNHYQKILASANFKPDLSIHTIKKGRVIVDIKNECFGVMDDAGILVPQSVSSHRSHARHLKNMRCQYVDCDAVYCGGGMAIAHFGHFLVEGINRIWPVFDKKYKNCKFVFATTGNRPVPKYITEMLTLAGIPHENIMFLNKPVAFRTVYVPDEAFDWQRYTSPTMVEICKQISASIKLSIKTYDKIYVSRAAMGDRKTVGEEVIQHIFEKNGYKIIYPEQLSIQEQIYLIKNCKYLAGCAGTALHLALFMPRGGTVIQIKRNSQPDDNLFTQNLINKTVGLNTVLIWGSTETIPTEHFTAHPQIIGPNQYFVDFLTAMKFHYDDTDLIVPDYIWQEYNNNVARYNRELGGKLIRRVKKTVIRAFSCIIPTRHGRKVTREFLERVLKYKNKL